MPLYNYRCVDCGDFRAWRSMSEAREAVPCPTCAQPVRRTVTAPNLALMAHNRRVAHQRNEKSAHEPRLESRPPASPSACGHQQHHGHGHQHRHSGRPWMIGH